MLTLLFQLNGTTIDRIDIVNRGVSPGTNGQRHLYAWRTSEAEGFVTHSRSDGAVVLVQRVIAELLAQTLDHE